MKVRASASALFDSCPTTGSARKKNYTLTLKIIGCERKCQFFTFFVALIEIWLQNQIERIILSIIPTFFVWIRHIWENKNITSSGCSHCFSVNFRFFGHFRLPEVIETPTKPQFQPLSMPSKKVWANILSGAAVMERPDLSQPKKKVVNMKIMIFLKCLVSIQNWVE